MTGSAIFSHTRESFGNSTPAATAQAIAAMIDRLAEAAGTLRARRDGARREGPLAPSRLWVGLIRRITGQRRGLERPRKGRVVELVQLVRRAPGWWQNVHM
jgi:hypothetical protein